MFDFAFTFNTGYYNDENQVIGIRRKVCINYLKHWFFLDLLSSIPFGLLEVFIPTGSGASGLVKLSRLRNIPKLLRLSRLIKIAKNLSYLQDIDFIISMNQRLLRFIKVIAGIILCIHVTGCLWFLSAKMSDFAPETWVVRFGYLESNKWVQYETSIYWALTTLTTLGYGDIYPYTNIEKLITMIWELFAVYCLSFSIGSLTTMFADMDSKERIINEKLLLVDEFFHSTQLSVELMLKLKRSIRMSTDVSSFYLEDKDMLFEKLPIDLKHTLAKNMYYGAISNFSFFKRDDIFIASIAVYLENALFSAGQTVWNIGEPCNGIYFIVQGRIHYVFGTEGNVFMSLVDGHYFGDVEIINKEVRRFDVISLLQSQCLLLPKIIALRISSQFPSIWNDIVSKGKDREKKIFINLAEMKIKN